ncbi:MAG: hypothetical protein WBD45_18775 [Terriglobales bacterium]
MTDDEMQVALKAVKDQSLSPHDTLTAQVVLALRQYREALHLKQAEALRNV